MNETPPRPDLVARCRLCAREAAPFAVARILNRHDIRYFQCGGCGMVQTEEPYWLEEAYSEALSAIDVGLVSRNLSCAETTRAVIAAFFRPDAQFIDYGGGAGLFVRLMRDAGLDFRWADKYATNTFARGFAADPEGRGQYELLTAFELFEHLTHPLAELERMLSFSRNILFSTTLLPANNPKPDEWWYYVRESGQHVALYTRASLAWLAAKYHLHLHTDGATLHLLTEKRISPGRFKFVIRRRVTRLINTFLRRPSLVGDDFAKLTGHRM